MLVVRFLISTNTLIVLSWLILLLFNLHELLGILLLLEHEKLLLLLRIKNINTSVFSSCRWDTSREISKLVELVEILSSLKKYLLIFSQMIIWVVISVSEDSNILLQISYLVIKINEFVSLLLD